MEIFNTTAISLPPPQSPAYPPELVFSAFLASYFQGISMCLPAFRLLLTSGETLLARFYTHSKSAHVQGRALLIWVSLLFETGSPLVTLDGLELSMYTRLDLKLAHKDPLCLYLPSVGIKGERYHIWKALPVWIKLSIVRFTL